MDARRSRSGPSPACRPASFSRQPPRVLVVEVAPPWWSETGGTLCDALDNVLTLASSVDGPCRLPLLCTYALTCQLECLLPFVQVRGNLARLRSCVEELRSLPGEGSVSRPRDELLVRAVLDSMQQYKQYTRHAGNHSSYHSSVEVTVVTSRPGRGVMRQLEAGLQGADLVSLRRILLVELRAVGRDAAESTNETPSPEETEDRLVLSTEIDLQPVDNSVVALETVLKAWLQEQGSEREHLHLLLPPCLSPGATPGHAHTPTPVFVKCDMQERLLSPALLPLTLDLGVKTESIQDFLPPTKSPANHSPAPQRLRAIKLLRAEGVCESLLYGLPLVLKPTSCWQLDWDHMEDNLYLFQGLCHALRTRDWFLLMRSEPPQGSVKPPSGGGAEAGAGRVCSFYVLQASPSPSLSLLLRPVVCRETLLPCNMPVCSQAPPTHAMATIQASLKQLEEEAVFNPLSLSSNLYLHLRTSTRSPAHPYRCGGDDGGDDDGDDGGDDGVDDGDDFRHQPRPTETLATSHTRQPRQQSGRAPHGGVSSRVRATVAPLPSATPPKTPRPALTMITPPTLCSHDDDLLMTL
ncbi:meiosis 1 arrest protein [Hypomesus transpacificus]|uniref:meiosis 1 arrest protein n=1 Tax=Hypomesus transpacificus TaxID=137520 RepID=UPI001F075DF0|nr:meiosis 1 arrest protein [Hypomesus transpacificus]